LPRAEKSELEWGDCWAAPKVAQRVAQLVASMACQWAEMMVASKAGLWGQTAEKWAASRVVQSVAGLAFH